MENQIDEIAFAELEHKGGQHKFAELPEVCYDCHRQKQWSDSMEDRALLAHLTGIYE